MRSDELITRVRRAAFIPDTHPEYTAAVILQELNATQADVFGADMTLVRGGYWLKQYNTVTVAGRSRYRIPPRSLAGGLERIELADPAGTYGPPLELATPAEIGATQGNASAISTQPRLYYVEGDQVVLLPMPATAGIPIRMSYYVRPSRLCTSQSSTLPGAGDAVDRGRITAVNATARTVTVNALPIDQEIAVPAAITSGQQRVDIVHPDGWRELALVGATQTIAGLVLTLGGSDSLGDVSVGDYVRVAEQTDWPALDEAFNQLLADATAARILAQLGASQKSRDLFAQVGLVQDERGNYPSGTAMARFRKAVNTRVKTSPKKVTRRTSLIHGASPRSGRWA